MSSWDRGISLYLVLNCLRILTFSLGFLKMRALFISSILSPRASEIRSPVYSRRAHRYHSGMGSFLISSMKEALSSGERYFICGVHSMAFHGNQGG